MLVIILYSTVQYEAVRLYILYRNKKYQYCGNAGNLFVAAINHGWAPEAALALHRWGVSLPRAGSREGGHDGRHQAVVQVRRPSLTQLDARQKGVLWFFFFLFKETGVEVPPWQESRQSRGGGQVQGDQQRSRHPERPHQTEHLWQIWLSGAVRGRAVWRRERQHLLCPLQLVGKGKSLSSLKRWRPCGWFSALMRGSSLCRLCLSSAAWPPAATSAAACAAAVTAAVEDVNRGPETLKIKTFTCPPKTWRLSCSLTREVSGSRRCPLSHPQPARTALVHSITWANVDVVSV